MQLIVRIDDGLDGLLLQYVVLHTLPYAPAKHNRAEMLIPTLMAPNP